MVGIEALCGSGKCLTVCQQTLILDGEVAVFEIIVDLAPCEVRSGYAAKFTRGTDAVVRVCVLVHQPQRRVSPLAK